MAAALTAMTDGITGINDATAQVRDVAIQQQGSVEQLDRCVGGAIARIETMAR